MAQGSVKWFNHRKGYGFILAQGQDVFVHYSSIEGPGGRSLQEGDLVRYDPVDTPRGPAATHVRLENAQASAPVPAEQPAGSGRAEND
jgi:CspA family cold shock protein